MVVYDVGGPALVPHGEEVGPSRDPLVWPHPMDPREALFVVDDMAEQAAWASASQSQGDPSDPIQVGQCSHHCRWVGHRGSMANDRGGHAPPIGEALPLCFVF